MSLPGMHAVQRLSTLDEEGLFTPQLPEDADDIERTFGTCFEAIGKGVLDVAQQTAQRDWRNNYVELHADEVSKYPSDDTLFPNRCGERYSKSRELISFKVPHLRRHICEEGDHQELLEIFGVDGWWLQSVVVDVIDLRGENQRVNIHLMMADTRRNPQYDHPFPDTMPVLNYVYLTLTSDGRHYCERFSVGCNVEKLREASMGRNKPENAYTRPLNQQTQGSIDEVMGRGSEEQLLQDLPKLGAFLAWFAQHNARS